MTVNPNDNSLNEEAILGILFSIELNPKDEATNEYIIENTRRIKTDVETLETVGKRRLGEQISSLPQILKSLQENKFVKLENNCYSLTELGKKIGKKVRIRWLSEGYGEIFIKCANSQAYGQFCERAYGKNLIQFNVVNMYQLDLLQKRLTLKPSDVVLDLGCGLGKITEYLANETKAKMLGIDFSVKAIDWAKQNTKLNEKLSFEVMDINELDFPANTFDAIIALDVLYWVDDLESAMKKIKEILKPNGRMGVFYVQFKSPTDTTDTLSVDDTRIVKLLKQLDFKYDFLDISDIALEMWKDQLIIGQELRPQFEQEGNVDIIDERLTDGKRVLERFEKNEQKRYFIYVQKK
ncbi:MAG TPA: methyltransferase domain-containing protein [Candidatus Bathyarchaeia archaeon]|nr:methyltransferase domain-containing protein [Candidatus Bathyarchaeia archaeon]